MARPAKDLQAATPTKPQALGLLPEAAEALERLAEIKTTRLQARAALVR
jgi:hypothetical protein